MYFFILRINEAIVCAVIHFNDVYANGMAKEQYGFQSNFQSQTKTFSTNINASTQPTIWIHKRSTNTKCDAAQRLTNKNWIKYACLPLIDHWTLIPLKWYRFEFDDTRRFDYLHNLDVNSLLFCFRVNGNESVFLEIALIEMKKKTPFWP